MRSIGEMILLALLAKWRMWREEWRVRRKYYRDAAFKRCDQALLTCREAFAMSKAFLQRRGAKEIYAYGETPLTTLDAIGRLAGLTRQDHVIDLGCGRGRGVFFLAHRFGCRATGIEWIPDFVKKACKLTPANVQFHCQHLLEADLSTATCIYLYGTCLEDEVILQLIEKFKRLPQGTKIITVSYALHEYCAANIFRVQKQIYLPFPWGRGEVFIQEVRHG